MRIDELLVYSDNCRGLLRRTLEENPSAWDAPLPAPMLNFRSVREIVAHMIGAEVRWVEMRIGGRPVADYEGEAAPTISAVFERWEEARRRTRDLIASVGEEGLHRRMVIEMPKYGWRGELTIEQMLYHVMNHEAHHRGQVSMALQQLGVNPPDFDYVFHYA